MHGINGDGGIERPAPLTLGIRMLEPSNYIEVLGELRAFLIGSTVFPSGKDFLPLSLKTSLPNVFL